MPPSSSAVSTVDSSLRPGARAGLHVEEVIEESLVARSCRAPAGPCGALRKKRTVASVRSRAWARRDEAAVDADHVGGQREADRGDAAGDWRRMAVGHQAVDRIAGGPEEVEGAPLDVVEERRQASGAAIAAAAARPRAPRSTRDRPRWCRRPGCAAASASRIRRAPEVAAPSARPRAAGQRSRARSGARRRCSRLRAG